MRDHGEGAGNGDPDQRRNDEVLPERHVDDKGRERSERHVVAMREVADSQHAPHERGADRADRNDRSRDQAIEDELKQLVHVVRRPWAHPVFQAGRTPRPSRPR